MTSTAGVDLAAEPRGTAVAVIDWAADEARVLSVQVGADDATVVSAAAGATRIGIDCAFGWPDGFVDFVVRHRGFAPPLVDSSAPGWRRTLTHRATDLACVEYTMSRLGRAIRPLSVSADLLGHVAMRCAVLLDALARSGVVIDRSGVTGQVAEVYPAATLALWSLGMRSYKGTARRAVLDAGMTALAAAAPWLSWAPGTQDSCRASDHAFDAVVAALGARAVALGAVTTPPAGSAEVARREGWIALPTGTLTDLRTG